MLTDGAELGFFVGAHATVLTTPPDAFLLIAAALVESGLTCLDQVLPLDEGRGLGGEVGFPGLCVVEIHGIVIAVSVFVAQAAEAVAELMYHDRQEMFSAGIAEII